MGRGRFRQRWNRRARQKASGGRGTRERRRGGGVCAEEGRGGREGAYTTRIALTSQSVSPPSVLRSSGNHSGGTSKPKPQKLPKPTARLPAATGSVS